MRLGMCFLFASATLAAGPAMGGGAIPNAVQGGALMLLGWVIWYLLAKALPAHYQAEKEERAAYLKAQAKAREDFLAALDDLSRDLREALEELA